MLGPAPSLRKHERGDSYDARQDWSCTMPSSRYRYLARGGSRSGVEMEPSVRFAKIVTCCVALAAGMYFVFLYLVASR